MGKGEGTPSSISFHLNGVQHSVGVGDKIGPEIALVDYIRDVANLKGTKVMCREGGCGACLITAKVIDPGTGAEITKSVNSCLTPVLSCDGWDISTVESLGDKHEGYHVLQNRIVNFHGTQCGYCTPGMVMNMHSLLEAKKDLEMKDVEKSLDGNICRCTGYRPILDSFKSLAKDASEDLQKKCADIEDCATCPLKAQSGQTCGGRGKAQASSSQVLKFEKTGEEWITAKTVEEALAANANGGSGRFIAGNTSTGIFKHEGPYKTFIDIKGIPELRKTSVHNNGITIGGGTTLTELINLLQQNCTTPGLEYGSRVATHLERVANISVRNNGTAAGNLMIKHKHRDFPSDVFVILEAIGASITLVSRNCKKIFGREKSSLETLPPMTMIDFLNTDMAGKLILSIQLPKLNGYHYRSFKITRRYQNAHAYVNAALVLKVNRKGDGVVVEEKPRIVYGGISEKFMHATATEASLMGLNLEDSQTVAIAFKALEREVKPNGGPLEASHEYRIQLAKSLLYKTILEIVGDKVEQRLRSGASDITRILTSAKQKFHKDVTDVALYKAVPKYEAAIQASGEAEYTGDIPLRPDELFAAYVLSTIGCGELVEVDASAALKIPGVVRLITAKDVPNENNSMKYNIGPVFMPEPIFVEKTISYYGQALGLILATTRQVAEKAAKMVTVKYANEQKPVVKTSDAIAAAKSTGAFPKQTIGKYSTAPSDVKVAHTVKGETRFGGQYHFYMESQSVVCHPREDGLDVFISSQWIAHVQNNIANVLGIPTNSINVTTRRLGGAFGGKAKFATMIGVACGVATWVSKRPVRMILDMETCMSLFGKRCPYEFTYEVGFDENGVIGSMEVDIVCDAGYTINESTVFAALFHFQNVYRSRGWGVDTHFVTSNTASNTYCRAPGSLQGVASIEWIMEHIANFLQKDPLEVRENNLLQTGDPLLFDVALLFGAPAHLIFERHNLIPEMIEQMKSESDYEARKAFIQTFNQENRWKKRGMAVVPVRYPIDYMPSHIPAAVAIYHQDGHVAVSHGGIEMGQGLHTKVIQTVAQILQIPMDYIKVKPTNNFVSANSFGTGGSVTSELVCYAVVRACEQLRENLRPVLEKLENPSWEKLIADAHNANVTLTAAYTPTNKDEIKGYDVWILNTTEVEIDALSGEYKVIRTDLYEDTGKSLSPAIDLGQIEGGYIYGQGFWTTEKIVHDENTGKVLTNGTWDYKVPECKDIPEDFRITLLNKAPNPHGVLRSKATGEPSVDAAFAVVLALRNAIAAARKEVGIENWFEMDYPVTPETVATLCCTNQAEFNV